MFLSFVQQLHNILNTNKSAWSTIFIISSTHLNYVKKAYISLRFKNLDSD